MEGQLHKNATGSCTKHFDLFKVISMCSEKAWKKVGGITLVVKICSNARNVNKIAVLSQPPPPTCSPFDKHLSLAHFHSCYCMKCHDKTHKQLKQYWRKQSISTWILMALLVFYLQGSNHFFAIWLKVKWNILTIELNRE